MAILKTTPCDVRTLFKCCCYFIYWLRLCRCACVVTVIVISIVTHCVTILWQNILNTPQNGVCGLFYSLQQSVKWVQSLNEQHLTRLPQNLAKVDLVICDLWVIQMYSKSGLKPRPLPIARQQLILSLGTMSRSYQPGQDSIQFTYFFRSADKHRVFTSTGVVMCHPPIVTSLRALESSFSMISSSNSLWWNRCS